MIYNIVRAGVMFGWFFFMFDQNLGPQAFKYGEYTTSAVCNEQRNAVQAKMPDRFMLPCFQEYILQQ